MYVLDGVQRGELPDQFASVPAIVLPPTAVGVRVVKRIGYVLVADRPGRRPPRKGLGPAIDRKLLGKWFTCHRLVCSSGRLLGVLY